MLAGILVGVGERYANNIPLLKGWHRLSGPLRCPTH
nr:MAG TPA: hypothetical protein [Caudoviricetes sp.]